MKILYAIQGTGNGHLSRARDIVPLLKQKADVDVLISGIQVDVNAEFDIDYKCKGLSFIFGKKGGIDLISTYRKANTLNLMKEIKSLPVEKYDLVLNDFEPVSAWAARFKKIPCISLSHQSAVISDDSPKPKERDLIGETILKNYAPTSSYKGFHFEEYNEKINTPVIRQQVRQADVQEHDHITVYLPAYENERFYRVLKEMKGVQWQVFSKHCKKQEKKGNVYISPIDNQSFLKSMTTGIGVLCGAGFETPAEALFLKKKLMVIPMKGQYEQQCNAAALREMGVPVIKKLKRKYIPVIEDWLKQEHRIPVDYPDVTDGILDNLLLKHQSSGLFL
jgi:uncharacterized protein (TIGR00661 family)